MGIRARLLINRHFARISRGSLNGNATHTFVYPGTAGSPGGLHGFSAEVPLAELLTGDNVLSVSLPGALVAQGIGNLDLTLEVP